jgi:signal transduction histidine kinase
MIFYKNFHLTDHPKAYHEYMFKYDLFAVRWIFFYGFVHSAVFILVDYYRAQFVVSAIVGRTVMMIAMMLIFVSTYAVKYNTRTLEWVSFCGTSIYVLLAFVLDYVAGMPMYFLPNVLVLLFYVINGGLSYRLELKLIQTAASLFIFILYLFFLSPQRQFHASQIVNMTVNAAFAFIIGFLLERYKQMNFLKREKYLDTQRQLEASNAVKTKLISILSHDLSSPLTSLSSLLKLRDSESIDETEMRQHSHSVRKSLEGTTLMLNNLVRWSKSQMSGFQPLIETIHLRELTCEVIESLSELPVEKNIRITMNFDDHIHCQADKEMIKLALRNILMNCLKFSHANGEVSIAAERSKALCIVTITDNGIGMQQHEVEQLFTFTKVSTIGTSNEKGSGLGLILSKEFIEINKGTIEAVSSPGKGSSFKISLPS